MADTRGKALGKGGYPVGEGAVKDEAREQEVRGSYPAVHWHQERSGVTVASLARRRRPLLIALLSLINCISQLGA